jgi:iron(III) transport system substrate-binding protein
LAAALLMLALPGSAQERVLNLYSARHYQTDEALYANFTKATGIRINRIDADDAGVITRLKNEGAASPADVVLLVDVARLWKAEADGLFQPVKSAVLEQRIPAALRGKDSGQGSAWFGFSTRLACWSTTRPGQARRRGHLRRTGRSEKQGQAVHRVGLASVQPLAVRLDARAQRPEQTEAMAEGPGCQHGARAEGTATPTRSRPPPAASARSH